MGLYACAALLAVAITVTSADYPYYGGYHLPSPPICDDCVCRVQAKEADKKDNSIFKSWLNAVFDKRILDECPDPRFPGKGRYVFTKRPTGYYGNYYKYDCECKENVRPVLKCQLTILKLRSATLKSCPCENVGCRKVIEIPGIWSFNSDLTPIPDGCICDKLVFTRQVDCKVFVSRCQLTKTLVKPIYK